MVFEPFFVGCLKNNAISKLVETRDPKKRCNFPSLIRSSWSQASEKIHHINLAPHVFFLPFKCHLMSIHAWAVGLFCSFWSSLEAEQIKMPLVAVGPWFSETVTTLKIINEHVHLHFACQPATNSLQLANPTANTTIASGLNDLFCFMSFPNLGNMDPLWLLVFKSVETSR